ncbi:MAG: hypothetical protein J6W29_07725, partial [Neisseriaceae bacterium]|nr:hypothetical protein [Neisseriaceae bacterium]
MIYEGQLIRPESAIDKIQAALDSGLKVKILAVQNTPETALDNTIRRFEKLGRGSSIEVMAQIMGKTADGLDKLHQHFGDRIELEIHERHENDPLPPQYGWEHLDILRKYGDYEKTKQYLGQVLEQSRETGTYSENALHQANGRVGRVEQKHKLSLTSALLAYETRPRVLGDSRKQSLLSALETLTPSPIQDKSLDMPKPERSAWGDFPPVIRNGNLGDLEKEPEYQAAKAGDYVAAGEMVNRLIRFETLQQIKEMIGDRKPIVVPVTAEEKTGANAIPYTTAQVIGRELGLPVDTNIVQINKVTRTGNDINHRFAFQPVFSGEVQNGQDYLIIDDTLTAGGTIASLKGYIENRGGKVVGATVMTAYESSLELPVTQKMLDNIQRNHGNTMNEFWQKEFGYGIDKLTNGEAGHLRKAPNVGQIRDRIIEAKSKGGNGVFEQTLPKADIQSPSGEKALNPDDEIPRPPQGGFVLPVENQSDENRQPENSNSKENQMATDDKKLLLEMLDSSNTELRKNAAASEMADDEVLRKAFQDKYESVRLAAVRNPNASSEFLQDAFNDAFLTEKEAILNHPNANEELFKEVLIYSNDDSVINIAKERLQNEYAWDDERFAALEQERLKNLSRYEQQRLQEESGLKKSELTAAPPLEKQEWQPDTFTPDTWQSETAPMTEQNKHLDGETAQKVDETATQAVDNTEKEVSGSPEQSLEPQEENHIDFGDDEITREEIQRAMRSFQSPEEKAQAVFKELQQKYGEEYGEYNAQTLSLALKNAPYGEQLHFDPSQERIVLSGVNPENNQRQEISDTSIKVMSVESIAQSIEDGRQEHQLHSVKTQQFPDESVRAKIDEKQDALEKRLMSGTDKLKLLTPPDAPPEELGERYAVAERKGFINDKRRRHRFDDYYTKRLDYIDRKDGKTIAFSDKGNQLSTSKSDQQTIADMLQVAKAKGWNTVKLRGNKEFKRQAYIEAAAMGLIVKGYSPTPQDLAMVEARKKELGVHSIEEHKTQSKEPKQQRQPEKAQEQPKTEKQPEPQQQTPQAAIQGGILLAHGKEHYHFNKANKDSYFATLQNPDGTKNTLWGRDIERAIKESGAEVGDRVSLQKSGVENVRVRDVVRDEQGEPVLNADGVPKTDEHMYQRNQYAVTIHEKSGAKNQDLPQERLIKHDLMGQPEKNPAEL